MYEAAHAQPEGESTVARLALTAAEYGYDGLVVRNHGDASPEYDRADLAETYGIDLVDGVEIRTDDPSRASGFVGNHRDRRTIVAVHGGSVELNRFAVEQPAVDVLAHPLSDDGDVNHVIAKTAAENGVHLEWSLREVLRADGGARVEAIRGLRKLRELIEQYDAPYVVSADATSHLQLRAPREVGALGAVLDCSPEWIEAGLSAWGAIADRNRTRTSDRFVEPGVRLGPDGDGES
ncbi:ribonuclease P-MRP protein subunit RPP1 [Halorhabdus tiamatea SARL4B]|uniref:Ribonuclease P protein component 3 n=1 Tax=Halorhabdus tiamatea SARL4B TaxID=1033806 RepID=F7PKD0_9EURY|nr:RNase P subunit p30 family protein [Halorhabdus tiamatea]ERJ06999.1 ribonuclease P-MRP protein subunit RPP1 [Halorhabdus tiamatea SARL4B]CCQ34770.1 ribonuclease P protein component 3 [Halorhabdus tiamatea SARL4B]